MIDLKLANRAPVRPSASPYRLRLHERLIDARQAAHCLNLQMYWLTHPKERQIRRIPHYRIGKLVRFSLQELTEWMHEYSVSNQPSVSIDA
jgi:hypothetical protein